MPEDADVERAAEDPAESAAGASGTASPMASVVGIPALDRVLRSPRAARGALVALLAAAALLGVAAWWFPEAVYDAFVWRYYYGPIVADAAGVPVERGGVTAVAGYNLVNTLTWAVVLGVALWNLLDVFRRHRLSLERPLVYATVPTIVAAGTIRGLVDLDWLPEPWAYLFITPNIYVVIAAVVLLALFAGVALERHPRAPARWPRLRHWHVVALAGLGLLAVALAGLLPYLGSPSGGALRWDLVGEVFLLAAALTAAVVLPARLARAPFALDPLYVLALFGQLVDGAQNYVGLREGYAAKMVGVNVLAGWLGDAGLLATKLLVFAPALWYIKAKVEPDPQTSPDTVVLMLIAVLALGLAMGFHGGVPLLLDR